MPIAPNKKKKLLLLLAECESKLFRAELAEKQLTEKIKNTGDPERKRKLVTGYNELSFKMDKVNFVKAVIIKLLKLKLDE